MTQQTLILGMETSCDETSVSVIRNGQEILSNTVSLHKLGVALSYISSISLSISAILN